MDFSNFFHFALASRRPLVIIIIERLKLLTTDETERSLGFETDWATVSYPLSRSHFLPIIAIINISNEG
jgi:hypothetical protein